MLTNILFISTAILLIPYCGLLLFYRKWFLQLKEFKPTQNNPTIFFSIIIPARNEEDNIGNCLQGIMQQNYPNHLFEVLVIDDHSTDNTPKIVTAISLLYQNVRLISLKDEIANKPLQAYKKKAIEIAISKSKGDWIVTTDADCNIPANWLHNFNDYIQQTNTVFVAAPVAFTNDNSVLSQFQYIDFMALQGATAASVSAGLHTMCNGANLAYKKSAFAEVDGFKGIDNIASGDDMLLMNKIKKQYKNGIGYIFSKDSIVTTLPMPTWKSFINQRIRWASKADKYEDKSLLPVLVMVYWFNLNIIILFFAGIFKVKFLGWFAFFLIAKTSIEWLFIKPVMQFFGEIKLIKFTLLQPLHIAYIVITGWLGKFGKYQWKERIVK